MKLKRTKKGFTIIELVIVIAVIGILAAVLIPTFVNLTNKANEAADQSLVKNLNTALAMEAQEQGHEKSYTLQGAINDLNDQGFALEQIISKSGKDLLWDQTKNEFLLNTDAELHGSNYWQIVSNIPANQRFSYYAGKDFNAKEVNGIKYGFDAGTKKSIERIQYVGNNEAQTSYIRGNGDQCTVEINAYVNPNDVTKGDVIGFYGFAKHLDAVKVPTESLHIYGSVNQLAVVSGHAAIESTGIVFDIVQVGAATTGAGASVTNNGYVAEASLMNNTEAAVAAAKNNIETPDGKKGDEAVGGDYLIGTLGQLETFRDAVNSGNNFEGLSVKLTKDITLNDGWTPIGEGNRDVAATNTSATGITTFFTGTFDGQGHTISNLNNKNFVPSLARITYDNKSTGNTEKQYAYGLFALVGDGAEIKNLTLDKVDFNSDRCPDADADSVGALVGFANGDLTVQNVVVKGAIVGEDAISGVVGRINVGDHTVLIENCENYANITSGRTASGIVRFYKGNGGTVTLTDNKNFGEVTSNSTDYEYFGGISVYINTTNTPLTLVASGNLNHGVAANEPKYVYKVGSTTVKTSDNYKLD